MALNIWILSVLTDLPVNFICMLTSTVNATVKEFYGTKIPNTYHSLNLSPS